MDGYTSGSLPFPESSSLGLEGQDPQNSTGDPGAQGLRLVSAVSGCPASCGGVIGAVCSVSLPFPFPSLSPTPQNDASIQTVHPGHQKPLSALWSPPRIHSGPAKDSKASDSSHPVPPAPMTLNSPADHTGSDAAREPLRQP